MTRAKTHYVITVEDLLNPFSGKPDGPNYDPRIIFSSYIDETTEKKAVKAARAIPKLREYLGKPERYRVQMRANSIDLNHV